MLRGRGADGGGRELQVHRGTARGSCSGQRPLPSRWGWGRHPGVQHLPRAFVSMRPEDEPGEIVQQVFKHWSIETTVEERRAHLGVETPRPGEHRAIERLTLCWLGWYSIVTLGAPHVSLEGRLAVRREAG